MGNSTQNSLALFDFDGTLTTKDTMIEFIRFTRGSGRLWLSFLWLSPILIGFKLGLLSNDLAKRKLLKFHFGGWKREKLESFGERFALVMIPGFLRKEAMDRLNWHQKRGDEIVVVTASLSIWTSGWLRLRKLKFMATEPAYSAEKFAGEFSTPNCNGKEKVNRVKAEYDPANFEKIYAYGDTSGDKAMLEFADEAFFRKFS